MFSPTADADRRGELAADNDARRLAPRRSSPQPIGRCSGSKRLERAGAADRCSGRSPEPTRSGSTPRTRTAKMSPCLLRTMPSASRYGETAVTSFGVSLDNLEHARRSPQNGPKPLCTVKCARLPTISSRQVRSKPFITERTVMISQTPCGDSRDADRRDRRDEDLSPLGDQVANRDEPLDAGAHGHESGRRQR